MLRTLAFSPNNQLLAAGGEDKLIIWSLSNNQMIKYFSRGNASQPSVTNYGMLGMAPGSGQSDNPGEEHYV